ncbi:MAG: hypothetical protein ACTSR8_20790 [Promethearchaeota archaeon]
MELLLTQVVEPAQSVKGEVTKSQILSALTKKNYTSKRLAENFELKQEYIIPQLTLLIKEGLVGRNAKNEYFLKEHEEELEEK